ncbi:unnamed protein product [Leptidea sinapis]|uniref:FLYWCH-type domain-containing protein n=1 Tax=Leptidea sinapis TaxID=189913 RepID=A0A5E4PZ03_9NEOP|nr:unnamed protein product [Leptidea sinapis]
MRRFVKKSNGSIILLYNGYKYSKNGLIGKGGTRFACSKLFSMKCKAFIHVSKDNIFIKANTEHNHIRPRFILNVNKAHFITLVSGKKLLMYKGYTYSRNGNIRGGGSRYACSLLSKGCKAYLHLTWDNILLFAKDVHPHEPLKFTLTQSGYKRRSSLQPWRGISTSWYSDESTSTSSEENEVYKLEPITLKKILVRNGKTFLMYKGYTYCRKSILKCGVRYVCTQTSQCRSYMIISDDGHILKLVEKHEHRKPRYHVASDGTYYRINFYQLVSKRNKSQFRQNVSNAERIYVRSAYEAKERCTVRVYVVVAMPRLHHSIICGEHREVGHRSCTSTASLCPNVKRDLDPVVIMENGKENLFHNGYLYFKKYGSKSGTKWNCTTTSKCSAFIYMTHDNSNILYSNTAHNHPRKNIFKLSSGRYIRV